ncbi:uncharacterized protein LOC120072032 [Benincasa hispida]|uniref:uncharacterized protein LOC120072032 n=1 Tax=Benincasa hispida TaxID=102211 RepID=UPI001901EC6A|nr:uncharacterized protein LOC120072032 [Benincasa hispida]
MMKDVVLKEIIKLNEDSIIYPIPDNKWVSPIHIVLKKTGMTIVENDKSEMVPMRIQNGWRTCIDFRKPNKVTKKDHFPIPFLNQMVERLAGKPFFCFLNGFLGSTKSQSLKRTRKRLPSLALMVLTLSEECHSGFVTPQVRSKGV